IQALDEAIDTNRKVVLLSQRESKVENPTSDDLYQIGTLSIILRMARLENEVRVLAQGLTRVRVKKFIQTEPYFRVEIEEIIEDKKKSRTVKALMKTVSEQFKRCATMGKNISQEMLMAADGIEEPGMLADMVSTNLDLSVGEKQEILETVNPEERLRKVVGFLTKELEVLSISSKIQSQAQVELGKAHREYVLREQLKAIQRELGEGDEKTQEIAELNEAIENSLMPDEVKDKAIKELRRLERMHPDSAESSVVRTYLDWMTNLPWGIRTEDNLDIPHVERILNEDHYGLEKIKERLLEYLSVKRVKPDMRGPILCFVGPPGTGKTSLGRSIARAMGRQFVRMSLGGIRDEAEIRGHRRTYVGALPGRIIQGVRNAESENPVFMLDEIDKLGSDFRGDPSSAMLEVLDPEQNFAFSDHYLEVPFDLSNVMFIATANLPDTIPPPLFDRMEVINLSSYTEREKIEIARRHLYPKQLENHGLVPKQLKISRSGYQSLVQGYTREAGVRNLERTLATLCRKITRRIATNEKGPFRINSKNIADFLGHPPFAEKDSYRYTRPGVATGLAWTSVGGDILYVEASLMEGKTPLTITGQIGKVMQESAMAALTFVRSNAADLGLKRDFFEGKEIHVHVPAGSTPKDGPSAGVTITSAMVSLFTDVRVRRDVAMTGEITLSGKVLPIGGVKEKVLAAYRYGIYDVIMPKTNESHLEDVPEEVRRRMRFHYAGDVWDVLAVALETPVGKLKKRSQDSGKRKKAKKSEKTEQVSKKKETESGNGDINIKKKKGKSLPPASKSVPARGA
ncbi:MAG TPA: endopeptidase La, partial [Firmicutes bacterium]|nr:endopeptidase La [Bacillota bacterium]